MFLRIFVLFLWLSFTSSLKEQEEEEVVPKTFPDGFIFGVSTSAFQIEGAWNEDGKGENNWEHYIHEYPSYVSDGSSADIACDSYHKHKEDVEMVKYLGVDSYRISLSWPRILPGGFSNRVNPAGIAYYNDLINDLLKEGIQPMVTLFHWDLPWCLQKLGGWVNPLINEHFEEYARVAFEHFGDRVKTWITFNEPHILCNHGYGGTWPPALNYPGVADYLCGHNVLKAHAAVYHMYQDKFKKAQKGRIGIAFDSFWNEPASDSKEDVAAAKRELAFTLGWFANSIFHPEGDYPKVMKEFVLKRSLEEGYVKSRLPEFTAQEVKHIRGTSDFFGLNYYSTYLTKDAPEEPGTDAKTKNFQSEDWPASAAPWIKNTPWGLRKLLTWIKKSYNDPEIIITENGNADLGSLCDFERMQYIKGHLQAVLNAIHVGKVNLTGYYVWSLMDNFEWTQGYTLKFGLYHVDFNSANRTRTPKLSVEMYKNIVHQRILEDLEEHSCVQQHQVE